MPLVIRCVSDTDSPDPREREGLLYGDITEIIIGAFYYVYNKLGYGFLEKVYRNALALVLTSRGLHVATEVPVDVYFEGQVVGSYRADLIVEDRVICEIKATDLRLRADEMQLMNYLRASELRVGLLLRFGPKPEVKRVIRTSNLGRT